MSKQDRQGVRTATDLERKYNFERLNRAANQVIDISAETREAVANLAQEMREEIDSKMEGYVEESELESYAQKSDLINYAEKADLNDYAKTDELDSYAKVTDLESYAKTADLEGYVETSELVNYAKTTDLANVKDTADIAKYTAQGVSGAVNDHLEFADGGTRIKGIFHALLLPAETDLDGVILPNRYVGGSVVDFRYLNCPITAGSFFLEVESCGNEGELLQRLTYSHKTNGKTYERVFYQDGWGQWIVVADYSGSALKAIQNDIGSLEDALDQYKSDANTRMANAEGNISTISNTVNSLTNSTQNLSADLQGVINDVNDHFEFGDGGTRIKGAINPLLIPAGTDLDGLTIPNKYIGGTVTEYNYVNCPVPSGTFLLDVELCGDQRQLKQILAYCNKTLGRTYERYYYGASWGEWVCVTDFVELGKTAKLLWNEGVYYMTATQTVNLPEAISAQKNGIILVFSEYANGAASDSAIHSFFIHKEQVALLPGKGYTFTLATSKLEYVATKNVFIEDTKISGHADNNASGTGASGFKYTNNRFVLRYVFGI